ncbi:amidohydrolase family protein [Fulvimarina sp. MAC8]|uniref:amidohydrolase family protein n=1 Tax=Fulvimarina sp. MAC8 TaxID=3162874 RepID=UPI0032ED368B
MSAWVLRNALLAGRERLVDILVSGPKIAEIGPQLETSAPVIDAKGMLVSCGFADSHIHLDKACINDRCRNEAGTLAGAIASVAQAKKGFDAEDIYRRGRQVIEKAIVQGTNLMRTHVEIDPQIGLTGFQAIRQLKRDYTWAIDIDICVFPQEGLINNPGTEELLRQALVDGADLLGGCPYMDSDPAEHIACLFALAREFDVDLDFHLDFDLDPSWRHLDRVATETIAHGWQGRVTVGHVTKLSALEPQQFEETAAMLADAGIAVTVLPATDLFLTGRDHDRLVPRGIAPADRLARQGVACTIATNNVLNPFTPYGDCSLTRMANLFANVAQIGAPSDLETCFAMISDGPRCLMGRPTRLEVGEPATFILLPNRTGSDCIAEIAHPVLGIMQGRKSFERPQPVLFGR